MNNPELIPPVMLDARSTTRETALHEAVTRALTLDEADQQPDEILAVADKFAAWLDAGDALARQDGPRLTSAEIPAPRAPERAKIPTDLREYLADIVAHRAGGPAATIDPSQPVTYVVPRDVPGYGAIQWRELNSGLTRMTPLGAFEAAIARSLTGPGASITARPLSNFATFELNDSRKGALSPMTRAVIDAEQQHRVSMA